MSTPPPVQPAARIAQRAAMTLADFRRARDVGQLDLATLRRWAHQAADDFVAYYHAGDGYLADAIALLCEISTLPNAALAEPGWRGLFSFLVERLSDSFNPHYCALYDRLFVQVVTFARRLPAGAALDGALRRFGLHGPDELLQRKQRLQHPTTLPVDARPAVRRVLIPSRVTIGADVAVTSVIMTKAKGVFPHAEIVLLAPLATRALYAGDARVRVQPIAYDRGGDLIQRLTAWLDVLAVMNAETAGLAADQYVVMDPDSRLTQLGIFPLIADDTRYYFFPSRGYRLAGLETISELAAAWLAETFGAEPAAAPYLALGPADVAYGQQMVAALRDTARPHLIMLNFGVGGNERKRVDDAFEAELMAHLLAAGSRLLLAKGVGPEEVARAERLLAMLRARGHTIVEIAPDADTPPSPLSDVVAWQGSLGAFAGLICASDLYLGYDSAGQHIAAALGVPTIDVFVDRQYPLIAKRWRPYGAGRVEVIVASTDPPFSPAERDALLAATMAAYHRLRR